MEGLAAYIIRRLLWAPLILLAVSLATFALGRFGPGDPVRQIQDQYPDPEQGERIAEELGYNDSFFVQYWRWLKGAVQGDFGEGFSPRGFPVKDVLFPRLWVTFQYNLLALIIIFAVGIPAGIWAALRQGTWMDPFTIGVMLFFTSVPVLVTIPGLQWLFALKLDLLTSSGWEDQEFYR